MKARIYKPSKSAMQSGRANMQNWVLEYETETARLPEDVIGWVSSGDTLNQVRIKFESKAAAIAFAEEKGWDYTLSNPSNASYARAAISTISNTARRKIRIRRPVKNLRPPKGFRI